MKKRIMWLGHVADERFGMIEEVEFVNGRPKEMKVSEIYGAGWLKAEDLKNRTVKVEIEHVEERSFKQQDGSEDRRLVVSFVGKDKQLILNRTQALALAAAVGSDDTDNWVGDAIMLSPAAAANGKGTINITRVPSEGDDRIPF